MRTSHAVLPVILALSLEGPQAQNDTTLSPLASMVRAELSFARLSAEQGMDSAFKANLAEDAIIFRPGPTNGPEWFRTHPAPPILLTWSPGFADVAVTGDLGYTTGPWVARAKKDISETPDYGDFVTVWRKRGAAWKVELDIGISHPAPAQPVSFSIPGGQGPSPLVRPDSGLRAAQWMKVLTLEQAAFGDSLHPASLTNMLTSLDRLARVFRPGHLPIVGADSIREFISAEQGKISRRQMGGTMARGSDLGYTYGAYHMRMEGTRGEQEGYYLTIWKKNGKGEWSIVLDLQSVVQKKE